MWINSPVSGLYLSKREPTEKKHDKSGRKQFQRNLLESSGF